MFIQFTKIDDEHIVDLLPLPVLGQYSEKLQFEEQVIKSYLQEQLCRYELNNYETVVLGCTHFSYYKDVFRKLLPSDTNIIDGNFGTSRNLKRILEENDSLNEGSGNITFYNSGIEVKDKIEIEKYNILFKRLDEIE